MWAWKRGVYLFFQDDSIKYIGRALSVELAHRIYSQITARGDLAWDQVIDDPKTAIGVIPLEKEDYFWAASIEAYVIGLFRSELLNQRSS